MHRRERRPRVEPELACWCSSVWLVPTVPFSCPQFLARYWLFQDMAGQLLAPWRSRNGAALCCSNDTSVITSNDAKSQVGTLLPTSNKLSSKLSITVRIKPTAPDQIDQQGLSEEKTREATNINNQTILNNDSTAQHSLGKPVHNQQWLRDTLIPQLGYRARGRLANTGV